MKPTTITPLVDAHAHIFTRDMPLIDNPRHSPEYSYPVEEYLAQLDTCGIRYGVIAAASPWGDFNDYTRQCVNANPRLKGTVILHPEKLDQYPLETMTDEGIVGIRLPFIGLQTLPDIRSRAYRRLFSRLAELDWHVHLHVEGKRIPDLMPYLVDAGPRLVIDHLGRPAPDDDRDCPAFKAIADAVNGSKAWIKASCGYRIGSVADNHFQAYLQQTGPERLFWASDCPFVGHEHEFDFQDTITWLAGLFDNPDHARQIFGENALGFYFPEIRT